MWYDIIFVSVLTVELFTDKQAAIHRTIEVSYRAQELQGVISLGKRNRIGSYGWTFWEECWNGKIKQGGGGQKQGKGENFGIDN